MSGLALSATERHAAGRTPHIDVALVFGAVAGALLLVGSRLLADPDTQWHIAVGRWIVAEGRVPWTDPFSHTFAGAPWIAKEWLSQVILHLVHATAGWRGVVLLTAGTIAGTFAWQYAWLRQRVRPSVALMVTMLALALAMGHFLARPHVFVFPVLLAWMVGLGRGAARGTPPWRLVPLMVLWANLHGSFTLGFVLAGLMALEALARSPRDLQAGRLVAWAAFGVALVLASCLSPYGYHAALVTLTVVESGEAFRFTTEWQPVRADLQGGLALLALALTFAALLRNPRENLARLLVAALLGYMMLRHVRFVSLFALVAPLLVAPSLARLFPPAAFDLPRRLAGLALAGLVAVPIGFAVAARPQPNPEMTPAAALTAARAAGLAGPVYNDHDFGGYLIAQGVPTFVDGRTDQLFLGGFLDGLREALMRPDHRAFAALLDERRVAWALVRTGSSGAAHLDALPGWSRVHADPVASVYRRT